MTWQQRSQYCEDVPEYSKAWPFMKLHLRLRIPSRIYGVHKSRLSVHSKGAHTRKHIADNEPTRGPSGSQWAARPSVI